MTNITLYHNPRCSKSRQALSLLQEKGIEPTTINYLEQPLDASGLDALLEMLDVEPAMLLRKKEAQYGEAGLSAGSDRAAIIAAIVRFPKLMERPVAVAGGRAVLGRPPERVLELL
ncbi:MAG: arsenate reductase (glutaredoxin) [Deltaproteobacteria bacterium]|nr:arsenate reductase (glutaredoxin) [Deltaproteobacteria bacterium]